MIFFLTFFLVFIIRVNCQQILGCNGSGRNGDIAFHNNVKHLGTYSWPEKMEGPYNCIWELTIDSREAKSYPMIKVSVVDFQTDCSQRSRIWFEEGGKLIATYYCGKKKIQDYIATSGKITIGLDVTAKSKVLISYQTVKSTSKAQASPGHEEIRKKLLSSKVGGAGLYQEQNDVILSTDEQYVNRNYPVIAQAGPGGFAGNSARFPADGSIGVPGNRPKRPFTRRLTTKRPMNMMVPTLYPTLYPALYPTLYPTTALSTLPRDNSMTGKEALEKIKNEKTMRFLVFMGIAVFMAGLLVLLQAVVKKHKKVKKIEDENVLREKNLVERCI